MSVSTALGTFKHQDLRVSSSHSTFKQGTLVVLSVETYMSTHHSHSTFKQGILVLSVETYMSTHHTPLSSKALGYLHAVGITTLGGARLSTAVQLDLLHFNGSVSQDAAARKEKGSA